MCGAEEQRQGAQRGTVPAISLEMQRFVAMRDC